jgi:hypothetical protein
VFLLRSIVNLRLALCQTVCKPGSVPPKSGDGHSSGTFVAERLARPTRAAARKARPAARLSPHRLPLLLGLAPGGVYPAAAVAGGAVRSYRTISPLPPMIPKGSMGSAVCFCGTFPGVAPAGGYPAPCLRGARTFLPPPGISPGEERPSDRLAWEDLGSRAPRVKRAAREPRH